VRAKQDRAKRKSVMPLLITATHRHGQGVVPETLNLAGPRGLRHRRHHQRVVNNQSASPPCEGLALHRYCTDITRIDEDPGLPRERRGSGGGDSGDAACT